MRATGFSTALPLPLDGPSSAMPEEWRRTDIALRRNTLPDPTGGRRTARAVVAAVVLLSSGAGPQLAAAAELRQPPVRSRFVFRVDAAQPTKDKPQSKIWHARGSWWAWLPDADGSSVWRREGEEWKRQRRLDAELANVPGRADVWSGGDHVRAVLVHPGRMSIVGLSYDPLREGYRIEGATTTFSLLASPGEKPVETATIARDSTGRLWVAYDHAGAMWVRAASAAGRNEGALSWIDPLAVGGPAAADDICTIAALDGSVVVLWSDQATGAISARYHLDTDPPHAWGPAQTVIQGERLADDHLNVATGSGGLLFVATKNSYDVVGRPQLALLVREASGAWRHIECAHRSHRWEPSRPVVVLSRGEPSVFFCYTRYSHGSPRLPSHIVCDRMDRRSLLERGYGPARRRTWRFPPPGARRAPSLNDVTGPKAPFRKGVPRVVLASDAIGRVYEIALEDG